MRRTVWLTAVAWMATGLVSCADQSRVRVLPTVDSSGVVEVATLSFLPDFRDSDFRWAFRAIRAISTVAAEDEIPLLFDPTSLLALRNGTLLVHDPSADHPLVLLDSSDRSALNRFGRTGQGPGELSSRLFFVELDEAFVVLDAGNRHLHRYSIDGTLVGSELIDLASFPRKGMGIPGAGFLLESMRPFEDRWLSGLERIDALTGNRRIAANLPEPSTRARPGQIQIGRVIWTVLAEQVVAMWSYRPVVVIYDQSGEVLREIRLPMTPRTISERDIEKQVQHYGEIAQGLEPGPIALTNELYAVNDTVFGMLTGELWKSAEDPSLPVGVRWMRLFTARGEYIGVVQLPDGFLLLGSSDRGLWARTLDENGYPVLEELELTRLGREN